MKPIIIALLLLAIASTGPLSSQTLSGTQLEVGPVGADQVSANNSGAIGGWNIVSKSFSFAVGQSNIVNGQGLSMAIGLGNQIGYGWPATGWCSLAVGGWNSVQGINSIAVGFGNCLVGEDCDWAGASHSLLVGAYNTSQGISSFIAGENNCIDGRGDYGQTCSTAVIGRGLISAWSNSLIVGKYNDSSIPQLSGLLFAIGNGADAYNRSNALEVYADGKIKMAPQGDILMGEFGCPPQ